MLGNVIVPVVHEAAQRQPDHVREPSEDGEGHSVEREPPELGRLETGAVGHLGQRQTGRLDRAGHRVVLRHSRRLHHALPRTGFL